MPSDFRQLDAYRRASSLAIELHRAVARWPSFDRWTVGIQLVRAVHSVAANIAEATGRWHDNDQRQLLMIARGSLHEAEHWIVSAEEMGLLKPGTNDRIEQIARPLNGLIRTTRRP